MSDVDPYLIAGSGVLKNRLGIIEQEELDRAERLLVMNRVMEGSPPPWGFDLAHLQAIHRHLFQDIYDWAGEVRTVEISKDGNQFLFRRSIGTGMEDIHSRLRQTDRLRGLSRSEFATRAGAIIGDLNYVHPFREGNGRTQLEYLRMLGEIAGHAVNPDLLDAAGWNHASRAAHEADYGPMARAILDQAMGGSPAPKQLTRAAAMNAFLRGQGHGG